MGVIYHARSGCALPAGYQDHNLIRMTEDEATQPDHVSLTDEQLLDAYEATVVGALVTIGAASSIWTVARFIFRF